MIGQISYKVQCCTYSLLEQLVTKFIFFSGGINFSACVQALHYHSNVQLFFHSAIVPRGFVGVEGEYRRVTWFSPTRR